MDFTEPLVTQAKAEPLTPEDKGASETPCSPVTQGHGKTALTYFRQHRWKWELSFVSGRLPGPHSVLGPLGAGCSGLGWERNRGHSSRAPDSTVAVVLPKEEVYFGFGTETLNVVEIVVDEKD